MAGGDRYGVLHCDDADIKKPAASPEATGLAHTSILSELISLEVEDPAQNRAEDVHSIVLAVPVPRIRIVPVIISAFESFAEIVLVLIALDVRIISVAAAAIDRRAAVASASAVSAVIHAFVVTLSISVFDRPAEHIGLTLVIFIIASVAICAIASLFGLTNCLLALFVSLLLLL